MRLMAAFFILIAVCFPGPVGAVGKSTTDPNARGKATQEIPAQGDLARKITYEARHKTVVSILADLSAITGVTLKAGYNNEDWQVRDRRMNIFVKDIPLSSLMNSIARVMKFQWSKSESEGVVSYRLYMDRKTFLGAESKRLMEEERVRKGQLEGRRRFLSAMEAAGGVPLDELVEQSSSVDQKAGDYTGLLPRIFADIPSAKQAYLSGEEFSLNVGSLSAETRQELTRKFGTVDGSTVVDGSIVIGGLRLPSYTNMSVWRAGSSVPAILPFIDTGIGSMRFVLSNGKGSSCFGGRSFGDPESSIAALQAKFLSAVMQDDKSEIETLSGEITRAGRAIDLGESPAQHPNDPALSAKVLMNVDGHEFANALAALAESSSFAVVSDSLDREFWDLAFHDDQIEIKAALNRFETVCRYNWERHGSTLELHDRDWYRKRAAQVPEAWLEVWRKAFKEKGMMDIDGLSQMALLTPEQTKANITDDDVLKQAGVGTWGGREILAMYAALDRQQRASIFTAQGLSLDSMTGEQSPAVQTLLKLCSALGGTSPEGLRLVGTREKQGKQIQYAFSVIAPSGVPTASQWTIVCPVYTPLDKPATQNSKS